jgi:hypothetical protein
MGIPDPNIEQSRRELEAFKRIPGKFEQVSQAAMAHGFFVSLEQARVEGAIGPSLFGNIYRRYYDIALEKIDEAQKETEHIRSALARMKMTATTGSRRHPVTRLSGHPDDAQFQEGLRAFQGWLASLFETYTTLFMLIEGANGTTRKVDELATASKALIKKRQAGNSVGVKDAALFKAMTEM